MKITIEEPIIHQIGRVADKIGYKVYLVGGYVRDTLLGTKNDDIDVMVLGKGKKMAEQFASSIGSEEITIFENFGTAMVKTNDGVEVEFVGARKESYERGSRKPIVEDGSLEDDFTRRDFTINAMGVSLNESTFGEVVDLFGGLDDLKKGIIRTPINPDITFSDDPLRQLRAIRFAVRFGFNIDDRTMEAIKRNAYRIEILSKERITTEIDKIMMSKDPVRGMKLLQDTGLMGYIFPEIEIMDTTGSSDIERKHKNIFLHTMQVLENVAKKSDNLWLRYAALFHDIGKMSVRKFENGNWTFMNHEKVGANIVETIFKRMKYPLGENMAFVKRMVSMHMRPQEIANNENVTDSAVRRLVYDAKGDIDSLIILCEADITTKHIDKKERFINAYHLLKERISEISKLDYEREFQPCVGGDEIMEIFGLTPSKTVGILKNLVKEAVLDGTLPNKRDDIIEFLKENFKNICI